MLMTSSFKNKHEAKAVTWHSISLPGFSKKKKVRRYKGTDIYLPDSSVFTSKNLHQLHDNKDTGAILMMIFSKDC